MSARLSSLLVAGGVVLIGVQFGSLGAAPPAPEAALRTATLQGALLETGTSQGVVLNLAIPAYSGTPRLQVLPAPNRVVVDLPGVNRGTQISKKDMAAWDHSLILKSRIAQFAVSPEPVTRLVLEVAEGTQVAVSSADAGVRIVLLPGTGVIQAKVVPFVPLSPSTERGMETEAVAVNQAPVAPEVGSLPLTDSQPVPAEPVKVAEAVPVVQTSEPPVKVLPALNPIPSVGTSYQSLPSLAVASLLPATPGVVQEKAPATAPSRRDEGRGRVLGDNQGRYTGAKITIDVKGADINTFLKIIAETAHLNLVADTDVQGNYDFKFTDCPWDQVLDVILKHAGLGKEISNGVLRVAKVEKLQKEEEDRKRLDEAKALAGEMRSVTRPLSFAKASDAKLIIEKMISKRGSIIVDDRTNTLIITDLPAYMATIDELIQTLDIQIQQVQIEARVVEASGGYEKAFGVRWPTSNAGSAKLQTLQPSGYDSNGNVSGYSKTDAPWVAGNNQSWNSINNRATNNNDAAVGFAPGKDGVTSIASPAGEFWVSFLSNRMSVNVILQALEKEGKIRIVSSPKVVTQNNKKAKILSGEKIPYPTQQGGAAGGAITVAFVDANLELDVTPQITSDGTIIMDLKITKAEADFSRTVLGTPTILNKDIETQVLVRDGGTAILGGIYTNSTDHQYAGVPFLSKLPFIGWLFRTKDNKESNSELLIFITPRVLKN